MGIFFFLPLSSPLVVLDAFASTLSAALMVAWFAGAGLSSGTEDSCVDLVSSC